MCVDCGCCPAAVYAGNDPLCWDCDAGERCPHKRDAHSVPVQSVAEMQQSGSLQEPLAKVFDLAGQAQDNAARRGLRAARAIRKVKVPAPKPVCNLRARYDRDEPETSGQKETPKMIPEHVKAKIIAEGIEASAAEQARRFGIGLSTVQRIRQEAGISRPVGYPPTRPRVPSTPTTEHQPDMQTVVTCAAPIAMDAPAVEKPKSEVPRVPVQLSAFVTEAAADRWWKGLDLEQKAAMIQMQLETILQMATA